MRVVGFLLNICRRGAARGFGAALLAALLPALFFPGAAQAAPSAVFPDKYSAIVVDANSNRVLFADNADLRRYPASLTKMMTLYLLFSGMKAGRISANSAIPISAYANGQPPTKLNLGAGQRIGAEDAAKALITKSANDIAVAIAEYLGGSESNFARMMNLKARQLGMYNSHFANASGLPDTRNYSTARDLAILALALRRDFPQQYGLFRTTSFSHNGRVIRGHNRLVANMAGVDGIKTGYTRMSGFNLASSRQMGKKSIVAVVMGGKTSALRDGLMAGLLTRYMEKGSARKGFAVAPQSAPPAEPPLMASAAPQLRIRSKAPATVAALASLTSGDIPVPTAKVTIDAAAAVPAATPAVIAQSVVDESDDGAVPIPRPVYATAAADKGAASSSAAAPGSAAPDGAGMSDRERDSAMLMMLASQSDAEGSAAAPANAAAGRAAPNAAGEEHNAGAHDALDKIITASLPAGPIRQKNKTAKLKAAKPAARTKSWAIQLTAGRSAAEAQRLTRKTAPAVRRYNHNAVATTEKSGRRGKAVYRIRYSGFASKAAARQSCARLQKSGHKCAVLAP